MSFKNIHIVSVVRLLDLDVSSEHSVFVNQKHCILLRTIAQRTKTTPKTDPLPITDLS